MLSRIAAARGSRDAVQERAAAAESRRKDWLEAIVFSSVARDKARRVRAGHSKVCCRLDRLAGGKCLFGCCGRQSEKGGTGH